MRIFVILTVLLLATFSYGATPARDEYDDKTAFSLNTPDLQSTTFAHASQLHDGQAHKHRRYRQALELPPLSHIHNDFTPRIPYPFNPALTLSHNHPIITSARREEEGSYPSNSDNNFNPHSCSNRCGTRGHSRQLPCQCNSRCIHFNDCCPDYERVCLTCTKGQCEDNDFESGLPCQCNKACIRHKDCCMNYSEICDENDSVTDAELQTLSEALLTADTNNVASLVTVNQQGSTSFHSHRDNAPLPLLTVDPSAYNKTTIAKLLPLHNNYVATVDDVEVVTNQETQEETAFLDVIMPTSVMKKAEKFLVDKGFISTRRRLANGSYRNNDRAFREAIHQIWFGLYSRQNGTLGSSGFEHVFLGEIKQQKVQGFHNWVFFSKEEQNNNLNYKGKIGPFVSLGNKGRIVKHKFDWINYEKPISSMFVGTSPEFEIALYTVCYYSRPGQRCPVKLNGKNVNIQTHYSYSKGKRYVGSAFPDI